MSTPLTIDGVIALAPDARSVKSAIELGIQRRWLGPATDNVALWGSCPGSGNTPYLTAVDLSAPAFKCTCPSRKQPCKHGLGLLLLYRKEPDCFGSDMPQPNWVAEWLDKRGPKSVSKPSAPPTLPLEGHATNRDAARINRVAAGLADLKLWLRDLVRQGIAETPSLGYRYWDDMAARMVDAQAPGAARQLREMAGIAASGGDWAAQLLRKIALLHLLIAGFDRMDQLSSDTQSDIKTALGWTISQADLMHKDGDADSWTVVGQRITEEDRLKSRRTWLFGEHDGSYALLLHFAHGNSQFENIPAPGAALDGELVHYPSAHPQRALMKEYSVATWARQTRCSGSAIGTAFQSYAEAISINPWLERFPMCLSSIIPVFNGTQRMLIDSELNSVPISPAFNRFWNLLSFSGGCAVTIFGEWDGMSFWPLTVIDNGQVKTL